MNTLSQKILDGQRISADEALILLEKADIYQLGFLARAVRERLHPTPIVTYIVDRNINYTDICISACKFCAFFKTPEDPAGSLLSFEELGKKIKETKELGGTQILLQGGLHPDKPLSYYVKMVRFIKRFGIHVHGFSPPEIWHFAQISKVSVPHVITRLREAGLDSIPGGGAEILVDRVRKLTSPRKCTAAQWLLVMAAAHEQGLRTTATMMFGHLETVTERIEHLVRLRDLQDRTGGFTAFIPWPFQPNNTALQNVLPTTAMTYLRLLAVSRIFLDNFSNIQASWVTQGPKIAELSLFFGANDFGSTMIEENVVAATCVSYRLSEQEIRRLVEDAGFTPRQRLMDYSLVGQE